MSNGKFSYKTNVFFEGRLLHEKNALLRREKGVSKKINAHFNERNILFVIDESLKQNLKEEDKL